MRRRRRLWTVVLAAAVVILAGDTLYWWIALRHLEQGFAAWEAEQRAVGWTDRHGLPAIGGWPLAARLTVPAISVSSGNSDTPDAFEWTAERLGLRVSLWRPNLLEVSAEGRERIRLPGRPTVPFSAARLNIQMPLTTETWPDFAQVAADDLKVDTPAGDASIQSLNLHLDFTPAAHSGESVASFTLKAAAVSPPSGVVWPLGPRITSLEADGSVNGPIPIGRSLSEGAAAWRDAGGSLALHHLAMVWGPLDLTATATLALDDELQPMGTGTAHLVGYAETLDALAAHGQISRSAAIATKAVLSLMAHNPEDGGPPDVDVPLTLQYRTLSMRQVPLVRLPEVAWQ